MQHKRIDLLWQHSLRIFRLLLGKKSVNNLIFCPTVRFAEIIGKHQSWSRDQADAIRTTISVAVCSVGVWYEIIFVLHWMYLVVSWSFSLLVNTCKVPHIDVRGSMRRVLSRYTNVQDFNAVDWAINVHIDLEIGQMIVYVCDRLRRHLYKRK